MDERTISGLHLSGAIAALPGRGKIGQQSWILAELDGKDQTPDLSVGARTVVRPHQHCRQLSQSSQSATREIRFLIDING
jgi:hypothetical protein